MSETFHMRYQVAPEMLRRATLSWAQPHRSRKQKLGQFALVILCSVATGTLLAVTGVFDLVEPAFWTGALIGFYAGLLLWLVIHQYSTRKLTGFSTDLMARQGKIETKVTAQDVSMKSALSEGTMNWGCFDQVIEMADATALRAGAMIYPIPNSALPENVSPQYFRATVLAWLEASRSQRSQVSQ